jgi:hypothetical protein
MTTIDPEKFRRIGLGGETELQLSFGLVLHFSRDMAVHGPEVKALWDELLDWRGRQVFTWARLGGGNKSRKMDAAAYRTIDAWLSGTKSFGTTCWIEVHGGNFEEIGPHSFALDGRGASEEAVSAVDVRLPFDISATEGGAALVKRLISLAGHLEFLNGSAGYMLHATPFGRQDLWPEMKKLVNRYLGIEPDIVEDGEWTADKGLTGVNWLTFVGAKHLVSLGGAGAVKRAAKGREGVTCLDVGSGVVLRAGAEPKLGDRNKRLADLDPYREVYEIVKPAIFAHPDYPFDKQHFDADETIQWVHRFARP